MSKLSSVLEPQASSSSKHFEEIDNVPLRQKIVAVLREAILSGELKPGDALVETALASQLGVSRAPLREALRSLNKDGLIETIPYRGTTVKTLSRNQHTLISRFFKGSPSTHRNANKCVLGDFYG